MLIVQQKPFEIDGEPSQAFIDNLNELHDDYQNNKIECVALDTVIDAMTPDQLKWALSYAMAYEWGNE